MSCKRRIILCTLIVLAGSCRSALADGGFIWHKGADLHEPSQKAIILHKDGVQDLILQVKYSGPAKEFCWIVPVPATPKLQAVDQDVFAELSLYTQKRMRWGYRQAKAPPVEVLARKKVGIFDTAVIKATDAAAIQQWLRKHGFQFPADRKDVLESYARKQWLFTAIRIDPAELTEDVEAKLHRGTLHPLLFTFRTKEIVYPLHISSINAGQTQLLLFVLSDAPVFHPWLAAGNAPRWAAKDQGPSDRMKQDFAEAWHGRTYYRRITRDELPKCRAILKRMKADRWFLTRLDGLFYPAMMVDDLTIKPDPGPDASGRAHAAFATRMRMMYAIQAAAGGNYRHLFSPDHGNSNEETARQRMINRVHGHVEARPGMSRLFRKMESDPVPTGWDRSKLHLRPAWIERLDEYERQCLLRSALMLHRQLVVRRASSFDPDQATLYYRRIDKAAMEACCHALAQPVPEYRSWESYQHHWQAIEHAVGRIAARPGKRTGKKARPE